MNKIPKIIHYCWFGNSKPDRMQKKCIKSWKKYLPGYKIICWNESNFDINKIEYTKEAYKEKKWAFVSDYVRFYALYNYGGIYLDTDVEIIKPIDDIIRNGCFMALESPEHIAPGLGLGSYKKHPIYKEILNVYQKEHFINKNNSLNLKTVVTRVTNIFLQKGFKEKNEIQRISDITIYPVDYFCPMKGPYHKPIITKNTRSIHHYNASWESKQNKKILKWFSIEDNLKSKGYNKSIDYFRALYFREYKYLLKKLKNDLYG